MAEPGQIHGVVRLWPGKQADVQKSWALDSIQGGRVEQAVGGSDAAAGRASIETSEGVTRKTMEKQFAACPQAFGPCLGRF